MLHIEGTRKFYNPNDLAKSRYFQLKAEMTQPFLITLFQAVMAFKRLAKVFKNRFVAKRKKDFNKSLLRDLIKKSSEDKTLTKFGQSLDFTQCVKKPVTESVVYKATSDGLFLKLQNTASVLSPFKHGDRKLKSKNNIVDSVSKQVSSFTSSVATGKNLVSAGEKLGSLLDKVSYNAEMFMTANKVANDDNSNDGNRNTSKLDEDMTNLIAKNFTLSANKTGDVKNILVQKEITEYMPGTYIYFGATVALQATHGGYLSYHDPLHVKASAHKILQSSRFMILNSDDLTDLGVLRYGDAVWLQAGLFDVLGASFVGAASEVSDAGSHRKIRPALINSRRENMFKAQQYGRWIVLKRDNPIGSIGQQVTHHDKIILEQEWYFLCSSSPTSSSMWRTKADMDELTRTGKGGSDLFNPISECTWKVHVVKLPKDDISNEKERQRDAQVANDQLKISANNRLDYKGKLSKIFNEMLDANTDERKVKAHLRHKESEETNKERLADLHIKKAQSNWDPNWISIDFLAKVYGENSIVTKMKEEVIKYKSVNLDYGPPTIRVERIRSKLFKLQNKYWDIAGGLLQNTKASNEMPTSLEAYYLSDLAKKIKAARVLQRCVRRYLAGKFNFRRSLLKAEKGISDKIQLSIRERRKIMFDQANNRKKNFNSKELISHSDVISIDKLSIFDNPNMNNADMNRLVGSNRATNMYSYLNMVWDETLGERRLTIHELQKKSAHLYENNEDQNFVATNTRSDTKSGSHTYISSRGEISRSKSQTNNKFISDSTSSISPSENIDVGLSRDYKSFSTNDLLNQASTHISKKPNDKIVASASTSVLNNASSRKNENLPPHKEASDAENSSQPSNNDNDNGNDIDHIAHFGMLNKQQHRPHTGNAAFRGKASKHDSEFAQTKNKLVKTKQRDYGLPVDVFEDTETNVNIKTGMKFLMAMSKNSDGLYGDIKFVKKNKNRAHSAPAKREK